MSIRHYWLAEPEGEDVVRQMEQDYHGDHFIWIDNPVVMAWVRNGYSYYSNIIDAQSWESALNFAGEQGELVKMVIPKARKLLRELASIITKQKLAFQANATSEGTDVIDAVRLGNAVAEHINEHQNLDAKRDRLIELAQVYGCAFIKSSWRTDVGDYAAGDVESGKVEFSGDQESTVHDVFDVAFDPTIENWEDQYWCEVRVRRNKWDLIEQHPELRDEILKLDSPSEWRWPNMSAAGADSNEDLVWVYQLFAKPTPAIPKGRYIEYSNEKTIYFDGDNKYRCIPIEMLKPAAIDNMAFGYPFLSDMLPAQEMLDHSYSAIATNQSNLAVNNVLNPRGSNVGVEEIYGANWISYTPQNVPGGGKPEALNLLQTSAEVFKFIENLDASLEDLSQMSAALRGNLPPSASGVAIATLTANALEFINATAKKCNSVMEKHVMHGINAYRLFAKKERLIKISGNSFQTASTKFVGSDLDPINNVRMLLANPMMLTSGGRSEMADRLMQAGYIKQGQAYFRILEGAPLREIFEVELSEEDLMEAENENLITGKDVVVIVTDDHPGHIRKHHALLNHPMIRFNNKAVGAVLDHIREHKMQMDQADPQLLAMVRTGLPPAPEEPPQNSPEITKSGGDAVAASDILSTSEGTVAEPADDLLGREIVSGLPI